MTAAQARTNPSLRPSSSKIQTVVQVLAKNVQTGNSRCHRRPTFLNHTCATSIENADSKFEDSNRRLLLFTLRGSFGIQNPQPKLQILILRSSSGCLTLSLMDEESLRTAAAAAWWNSNHHSNNASFFELNLRAFLTKTTCESPSDFKARFSKMSQPLTIQLHGGNIVISSAFPIVLELLIAAEKFLRLTWTRLVHSLQTGFKSLLKNENMASLSPQLLQADGDFLLYFLEWAMVNKQNFFFLSLTHSASAAAAIVE